MTARPVFAEFMNSTERNPTARQGLVDVCDTERQYALPRRWIRRGLYHPAKLGQRN
jgi:hypothetical protein